jgi:hypothetical protein
MKRSEFLRRAALAIPAAGLLPMALDSAAAQGRGQRGAQQSQRKRVLIWADTRNGISQHESVSHAMSVIERMGYEAGVYDSFIRTDSNIISKRPLMTTGANASGGPSLANVDAIFFLGHREVALTDDQKADLLSFVRDDGKGFVATHTATTAFLSWPEFGELIGGRYDGHPWGSAPGFALTDEFYQTKEYSREKIRVVLRLDVSKMPANNGVTRTDGDFPLAWAKMYGKGRVFYSSLGHASATWDNPDVSRMYFEALKWSMGLSDADVTPRPWRAGGGRGMKPPAR